MPKKTFGEMVAELRKAKELKQIELAESASVIAGRPIAGSTVARIERSRIPISDTIGVAIIEALKPTAVTRAKLEVALAAYQKQFVLPAPYKSGIVLGEVMRDLDITDRVLSEAIGSVHQAVQAWRSGVSLMSDERLTKVKMELKSRGVSSDALLDLTRRHIYDVLFTMPRLTYLTTTQRKKLASLGSEII